MIAVMNQKTKDMLRQVGNWPEEDQEELAEVAREIAARRAGTYVLNDAERAAIVDAQAHGLASEQEIAAFWKRHGIE